MRIWCFLVQDRRISVNARELRGARLLKHWPEVLSSQPVYPYSVTSCLYWRLILEPTQGNDYIFYLPNIYMKYILELCVCDKIYRKTTFLLLDILFTCKNQSSKLFSGSPVSSTQVTKTNRKLKFRVPYRKRYLKSC